MKYIYLIKKSLSIFSIQKLKSPIKRITEIGIKVSFVALLFSTLLMALYVEHKSSSMLYQASSLLIHSFSMFIVYFLIMGVSFNKLLSQRK